MRRGQRLRQGGFIYLRTGGNGSCKTLFTLADVRKLQQETSRPVFYVEGRFKPKPIITDEFGWKPFKFAEWQDLPDGSICLCDEVHYDLPIRKAGAEVPQHIAKLSEHRSRGFDFFMLTQHPQNIDVFVRRLVQAPGWHQHLKRVFGASNATRVLQWDAVNAQCEKDGSGESAQITTRTQPKEVFQWYDSAFMHTGKKRIPFQVWLIVACVPLVLALVTYTWYAFTKNQDKTKERITGDVATSNSTADGRSRGGALGGSRADERPPLSPAEYVAAYKPRVPALMHTAPAYDELTKPKRVPVPAACVESKSQGCKCYTQDATPYPTPADMCRQMVRNGIFLAFSPEGAAGHQDGRVPRQTDGGASTLRGVTENAPTALPGPAVFEAPGPRQVVASTQAKPKAASAPQ